MRSARFVLMIVGLVVSGSLTFAGTPQYANFAESVVASMNEITGLCWATDGSNTLFVTERDGYLRVIRNGTLQLNPVATLTPVYRAYSEMGLLGIAVDPGYAGNSGNVFVFNSDTGSNQRIWRYSVALNGGGDLIGTGKTQFGPDLPTLAQNHDGGSIAIGPDGYIYWGVGNLGNGSGPAGGGTGISGGSDEWTSYASKICRMDRSSGDPVPGGPFASGPAGRTVRNYTWSKGYRNPFGMTFQPGTASPWILEVGDSWEHIFVATGGSDRGWNLEDNQTNATYLIPRFDYQRNSGGWTNGAGCLTRGCFYNSTAPNAFPAAYQGNLFFAEHNAGRIIRAIANGTNQITAGNVTNFVDGISNAVDVKVGPDGALYYAGGGTVYRLAYTATTAQNIILSTGALTFNEGSSGTFTVRLATAPTSNVMVGVSRTSGPTNVTAAPASLTFTPGNWNTPQTVTVSAAMDPGTSNVGATITCSSSGLASQNVAITVIDTTVVNGAPSATITQPLNGAVVSGTNADFFGPASDPQGITTLVRAEFRVDGVLVYTDTTPMVTAGDHYHLGGSHSMWNTTNLSNGTHTLRMTVYDSGGLSGSHQITVTVDNSGGSRGMVGQYYNDMALTNLVMTRVDPGVNFNWGTGSPDPAVPADGFSVRWTGQITPTYNETYTFFVNSDDGARLWVNGTLLSDHWVNQGPTEWSGTIALTAGAPCTVVLEYFENAGGAVATLSWSSPSQVKNPIPSSAMSSVTVGSVITTPSNSILAGCGLTGFEAGLVLGLLALIRRKKR